MVRLNRIYTRTGDDGTTGLVDGTRVAKDDPRMAAIGEVDELNSALGLAIAAMAGEPSAASLLQGIQNDLFDLGADLATPGENFTPSEMVLRIVPAQVERLEQAIDRLNDPIPPLRSFILPGGSESAARVHLARAIARRAERVVLTASRAMAINPAALAYLNRLSDLLFVLARALNGNGAGDILWVPGASRAAQD
ncbi:putative cobalamin adenosyltransferase [Sphingobium sp. SYK-6]|uniref:cob(I)yrinic acid a,c-diamide adenosyltransferase n=1 Tax=Sphingobium sp. (strain NBRC 103272 / SYK-6) TaxID=627192 RepID=UPI0002276879|nr:cob(I)yrinic acid a,c-diamide adenosyltransferase [Sphingobium sp. SYK-6]BAK65289.1 putative cobalamin adenosyltransferase [Sphingobium sp. SYK-6]